jgi:hypothetical protein
MNWATWLGIFFGALSILGLYYGSHLSNQKSSQDTADLVHKEVNKVLERIDTAKQSVAVQPAGVTGSAQMGTASTNVTSQREAQQQLADIEKDFSQWASNFIKNRDLKKLEFDRQQLDTRTKEIEISNKCRPLFQYAIDSLRGIIHAYNDKAGSNFKAELRDLPTNLYPSEDLIFQIGKIDFGDGVSWNIYTYVNKPARADAPPFFQIDISGTARGSGDVYRIQINSDQSAFHLFTSGGGIATAAKIEGSKPLDDFKDTIRSTLERLIETQISSLRNH